MGKVVLKLSVLGLFFLFSIFYFLDSIHAQSDNHGIKLTISPLPIQLSSKPGTIIKQELKVRNSGTSTEVLEPGLLTFSADNKSGDPVLHDLVESDEIQDWVSFAPDRVELDPLEWGTTTMTIDLPQHAAYGYYFAVVWGSDQAAQSPAAATQLIGSVAQLVLLEVDAPGLNRDLRVGSFQSDHKWYEFLPVEFSTTIENIGNTHVAPFGNIFITDGSGNKVDSIKINENKGNILPGSQRTYSASWARGFPRYVGEESKQRLDWGLENAEWWRFGKYHAQLVMAYQRDGQDVPLVAETTFWVIPWRLILLVLAIPIIPSLVVYFAMKRKTDSN